MATVEYSTDGGSSWSSIDYHDFMIKNGNGQNLLAPIGKVWTKPNLGVSQGDLIRIKINNTRRFEGILPSEGKVKQNGVRNLKTYGYGYEIMQEEISLDLSSVSPETVLENALDTQSNSDYDSTNLNTTSSTGITLNYDVEQTVGKIFREMMARSDYVIRIDPDKTINFEPYDSSGAMGSLNDFSVKSYEKNSKDNAITKVTVKGTQDQKLFQGIATDFSNIDQVIEKVYHSRYVDSDTEAQNLADKMLEPSTSDNGTLVVWGDDFTGANRVNYNLDFYDESKNLGSSGSPLTVVVQEQKIMEQHMELKVGKGSGFGVEQRNFNSYAKDDKTHPGATQTTKVNSGVQDYWQSYTFPNEKGPYDTDVLIQFNADYNADSNDEMYLQVVGYAIDTGSNNKENFEHFYAFNGNSFSSSTLISTSGTIYVPEGWTWKVTKTETTGSVSDARFTKIELDLD